MFDFNFFNKLTKTESTAVLMALRASLGLGISPQEAIELQAKAQTGKTGRVLKSVSYLINKREKKIADTLYNFGIINLEEKYVLENSGSNMKETIDDILKMREMKGRFNKTLFSLLWIPVLSFPAGIGLIMLIYPKFQKPYESLIEVVHQKGLTSLNTKIGIWYIDNFPILKEVLIIYGAVIFFIVGLYMYLRKYKPTIIYNIFKLAAYDDIPFILSYMRSLHKVGLSPVKIAEILQKANHNPGWKPLFVNLKNAIINSKPVYKEFKKFGFPSEITLFIQYAEQAKDFWGNIDRMIKFAETRSEDGNAMVKKIWGGLLKYIGYSIIIYFLAGIIMLVLQMQTIAISLSSS